ncbi:MAG: hypothetical protein EBR82_19035 [Caulobacteraceae bacterium]|nr:hypothetical protein [Caulobacteraceae bacterium]
MTREAKIAWIEKVCLQYTKLNEAWEPIVQAFKNHDFPVFEETWRMFDLLIDTVEAMIDDEFSSLTWFIYENKCGEKGLEVSVGDKLPRACRTPSDLIDFIEYCTANP